MTAKVSKAASPRASSGSFRRRRIAFTTKRGRRRFARISSGRWMPVRGGALSAKGLLPTTIAADESSGGLGKAVGVP
jgi:hypothetical protein